MIQQTSLLFAGPALAAPLAGAAQPDGKDADTDFRGWMDLADVTTDPPVDDALLLMAQIAGLVVPPPSAQPMQALPEATEDVAIALPEVEQALARVEQASQPPFAGVLPEAGNSLAEVALTAAVQKTKAESSAQTLSVESSNQLQTIILEPKSSSAAPEAEAALQQDQAKPLPVAADIDAPPPLAEALAASDPRAKAKAKTEPQPTATGVATAQAVSTEVVALAASQGLVVQIPQSASARSSAPTPHWSRSEAAPAVTASKSDTPAGFLPQAAVPDPQIAAEQPQNPEIGPLSQNQFSTSQPETTSRLPVAPPAAPLHSQLLTHAPSALQKQVEVLLSPEELGHVRFQIRHSGDSVSIFLSAERPETMDMLRRNGDDLLREFRQAGFSGASLDFGQWGQQPQPQQHPPAAFSQPDDFSVAPQIARPAPPAPSLGQAQGLNLRL